MKERNQTMTPNRKLTSLVNPIAESICLSTNYDTSDDELQSLISLKVEAADRSIYYFTAHELKDLRTYYHEELNKRQEEKLKIMASKGKATSTLLAGVHEFKVKKFIIEAVIEHRKFVVNKKGDVPIIIPHVKHPVFSASFPKTKSLLSKSDSPIIFEKRTGGFQVLYFKNPNGNLLTEYDHRVFSALCKLCEEKGYPKEMEVEFLEILDVMNVPAPSGGDYRNIENSLLELFHTTIVFERQLKEHSGKLNKSFHHIIQHISFSSESRKKAIITFQDYVYDSLKQGEYFLVNMFLLNEFNSSLSKSLYRFLLHDFSTEVMDQYVYDFDKLHGHLDHDRNNPARARQNLKRAFEEIKELGIIRDFVLQKIKASKYQFIVYPAKNAEHLLFI